MRTYLGCVLVLVACGEVQQTPDASVTIDSPSAIDAAIDASNGVAVSIMPDMPRTADNLVATVTGLASPTLRWSKDGTVRTDIAGTQVDNALTAKGEVWKIEVLDGGGAV